MEKTSVIKDYKWDVAISLCKQDIDFARKLVKTISPTLKVFFYENQQEELIGKSGPEAFARVFKEECRVVVIISRDEWSKSYYTEIERNAIIDRTAVKNEGYQFLMIIPMLQGQIPPWYPSTQIYANAFGFPIEELAHFIEFKVTENGGIVKPLTLEDRYLNLLERIEAKKSIINLQHNETAIQNAKDEMDIFKICFNEKGEFLRKQIIDKISWFPFTPVFSRAHIAYGNYLLECQFSMSYEYYYQIVTTQDIFVTIELSQIFANGESKKSIEMEQRVFYYTPQFQGWGLGTLYEEATNQELQVLFRNRDNTQFYDLTDPLRTATLVDKWFQLLLSYSTKAIEGHL